MRNFDYLDGELHSEGVKLSTIAAEHGTPVYIYSSAAFERQYQDFARAFKGRDALIAYSVKANSNLAVLATLAAQGAGADVVSGGELVRALTAGIPPKKIVFSGVGKTRDEMRLALQAGIHIFNVESLPELEVLNQTALEMKTIAPIAFRINPDVTAGGHEKITTGKAENKFGIAWKDALPAYARASKLPGIAVRGVDVHIGSQIVSLDPFRLMIEKMRGLMTELRAAGHTIESFDLGGGLGINYGGNSPAPPNPQAYGDMVRTLTKDLNVKLIFEPGRVIAGNAGVLLSRVIYVKHGTDRNFLIIDAAMNDLIRPALYDAFHDIEPVRAPKPGQDEIIYDVVGPVCETGDTFARQRALPEMKAGDLLVFRSAGAYGATLSSQYNTRPLVPEILIKGGRAALIRERPTYEDILKLERLPDWLS